MNVYCVFSLETLHRGDSNEYTQYTISNMNKKNTVNYPKSAAMDFFQRTQERVRNSRGKRAIRVRATEGRLYFIQNEYLCNTKLTSMKPNLGQFFFFFAFLLVGANKCYM